MKNTENFPLQLTANCALCNHPQRVAAASMKELGATLGEIATAVGLDAADVERHFTACVKVISLDSEDANSPVEGSDQQLQVLLQNATELYHSSVLMGNYVSASSALAVRLRCLTEIGRRAAARSERKELLVGADPHDPQTWPHELAQFINAYQDDILRRVDAAKLQEVEGGF
ncbi:MAG: hypothetical protein ABSA80_00370 [Terriglobales bacterium]|jgi:hypothetical protein